MSAMNEPAAFAEGPAAASPSEANLSAHERLARSRASLTRWLADDEQAQARAAQSGGSGLWTWLRGARSHPLAALALDALTGQWKKHPLHTSVRVAEAAAQDTLAPLVRRHPAAVLGAAAVAGALLVRARPWRWLKSGLLAGVVSQVVAQLIARAAAPNGAGSGPRVRKQTDASRADT